MTDSRGRARFGILVPFTNTNLEPDMAMLRPDGVSLHFARLGGYDADEIPDENQMQGLGAADLDEPLALLMGARPDVVIYGCTSATLSHGPAFDRALASRIETTCGAATVTAAGALVHALGVLGQPGSASPRPMFLRSTTLPSLFSRIWVSKPWRAPRWPRPSTTRGRAP